MTVFSYLFGRKNVGALLFPVGRPGGSSRNFLSENELFELKEFGRERSYCLLRQNDSGESKDRALVIFMSSSGNEWPYVAELV